MIVLEKVSKSYSAGAPAINDIDLKIEKGDRRVYPRNRR